MKVMAFFFSLLLLTPISFANNEDAKTNADPEIVAALVVLNNNEITVADLYCARSQIEVLAA